MNQFKIETLNLIYFIPGIIALAVPTFYIETVNNFYKSHTAIFAVLFPAAAYCVGYGLWGIADLFGNTKVYKCRMQECFGLWSQGKKKKIIIFDELLNLIRFDHIGNADGIMLGYMLDYACDNEHPILKKLKDIDEFKEIDIIRKEILSKSNDSNNTQKDEQLNELIRKAKRIRRLFTNELMGSEALHSVGAFLSSWNNVKFTQTMFISLVFSLIFQLYWIVQSGKTAPSWELAPEGKWFFFTLFIAIVFHFAIKWRLRVYARDLVFGCYESLKRRP